MTGQRPWIRRTLRSSLASDSASWVTTFVVAAAVASALSESTGGTLAHNVSGEDSRGLWPTADGLTRQWIWER